MEKDYWQRAKKFIPNGCQTLSKGPERYVNGIYPKLLVSGHGCETYDEEGEKYIDYISALGANLLGYNNPAVDDAVKETINSGQVLLSLPHPKEGELAEKLSKILGYEKIKFFKTGSEATSAAVRVAREFTKKDIILMCGYNGWHDWAAITYDRPAGIPKGLEKYTRKFEYNNIDSLRKWFSYDFSYNIAAIILEPVIYDEPKDNFLQKMIDMAHENGALVIFDEIVTGLRFGKAGAAGMFNVKGDLVCMGKSLGNGYPISVLAGNEPMSVFEQDDFIASGTFSGELTGISAALAVLEQLDSNKIWVMGSLLKTGFNSIATEMGIDATCVGYGPRTRFDFPTLAHKALFWQECVKKGILFGYCNFPTQSHGASALDYTLLFCREALGTVKDNWNDPVSKLEGKLPIETIRSLTEREASNARIS